MADLIHQFHSIFSVWTTTRAAGIAAYVLLSISMVFGILQGYPGISTKTKATFYTIHESTSWFGLLLIFLHAFVLIFDKYVGYTLSELLIPFTTEDKPFLNGLGILAMYFTILLVVTSDLRHKMRRSTWKTIHYTSILAFGAALAHGVLIGTDTKYDVVQYMYWVTGILVVGLAFFRPSKKKQLANATGNE